jgi:hypothetical protein
MTMPGFTAEVSCDKKSFHYPTQSNYASSTDLLLPADQSTCGACSCDPGRCCDLDLFGCRCKACGGPEVLEARPTFLRA